MVPVRVYACFVGSLLVAACFFTGHLDVRLVRELAE